VVKTWCFLILEGTWNNKPVPWGRHSALSRWHWVQLLLQTMNYHYWPTHRELFPSLHLPLQDFPAQTAPQTSLWSFATSAKQCRTIMHYFYDILLANWEKNPSWQWMDSPELDPIYRSVHWAHESTPKQHLDCFPHFCTAHPCAKTIDLSPACRAVIEDSVSWSLTSHSAQVWLYQRWKARGGEPSLQSKGRPAIY